MKGRKKREIGPGDYIGEMAIIDGGVRSATVTAETDVVTLSAARWNFEAVLKSNPNCGARPPARDDSPACARWKAPRPAEVALFVSDRCAAVKPVAPGSVLWDWQARWVTPA